MSKKYFLVLFLGIFILANTYSSPEFKLSAGGGLYSTGDLGSNYVFDDSIGESWYYGAGLFAFFDMNYIESNFGFFMAGGENISSGGCGGTLYKLLLGIDFGLLFKYPFKMTNQRFNIYPLMGINYRIMPALYSLDDDSPPPKNPDMSSVSYSLMRTERGYHLEDEYNAELWFKLGGGLAYSITDKIYFRSDILYGILLDNKLRRENINAWEQLGSSARSLPGRGGLDVKLAVGFNFN